MPIDRFLSLLMPSTDCPWRMIAPNFVSALPANLCSSQSQTQQAFANKWKQIEYESDDFQKKFDIQKKRYLDLYGFSSETELANYLRECRLILDAGSGQSDKAAWLATLSPETMVVAAEISDSIWDAARYYESIDNLYFIQCDIASLPFFADGLFDYVSCDQVIHHTTDPRQTFHELVRVTSNEKDISVYVYRKKALPRELLDEYFRDFCRSLSHAQLMEFSRQITELGRILSAFEMEIDFPPIPLLGIEGGKMTVQRFLYWNFLKCFWNKELGFHISTMTNYDWYSPSQAFRYSEAEFRDWIETERLREMYFHKDEASYSGRFRKNSRN